MFSVSRRSGDLLPLTVCVSPQVSALYFTSATIALFDNLRLRRDSGSACVVLWDDLVRGRHRSCYTVTHRGHTPAWVREGGCPELHHLHKHTHPSCQSHVSGGLRSPVWTWGRGLAAQAHQTNLVWSS